MSTTYSEDHPDFKGPAEVEATPVEGLDREPKAIRAKVVEADAKPEPKKSDAQVTTKSNG